MLRFHVISTDFKHVFVANLIQDIPRTFGAGAYNLTVLFETSLLLWANEDVDVYIYVCEYVYIFICIFYMYIIYVSNYVYIMCIYMIYVYTGVYIYIHIVVAFVVLYTVGL